MSVLPECLVPVLTDSLDRWRAEHSRAVARGAGRVRLPTALGRKYPSLETDWGWQWVFPAARDYFDREDGRHYRHHIHESTIQKAVRDALGEMLSVFGFTVETYASADAFLAALRGPQLGCIVADVRMPGTDGIELVRELLELGIMRLA